MAGGPGSVRVGCYNTTTRPSRTHAVSNPSSGTKFGSSVSADSARSAMAPPHACVRSQCARCRLAVARMAHRKKQPSPAPFALLFLAMTAAEKDDTEQAPCVVDATVAERMQAPLCAPLDASAPLCSRPHPMLDWFNGSREEALAALSAYRPGGTNGELDNATELCAMWDTAACPPAGGEEKPRHHRLFRGAVELPQGVACTPGAGMDLHTLTIEMRALADDGCFELFPTGTEWAPDGAPIMEGLLRWQAVAHIFGSYAASHHTRFKTPGQPNGAFEIFGLFGTDVFSKRAPGNYWNSAMHYAALQNMAMKATYGLAEAISNQKALCDGLLTSVPNYTMVGVMACIRGIGQGVFELLAEQQLPDYVNDPCIRLRYKPEHSALAPPEQYQLYKTASFELLDLIQDGVVNLNSTDAEAVFQGLSEGFFSTIHSATPNEFLENNDCARLWQEAKAAYTDEGGLVPPLIGACLNQAVQWVLGTGLRKTFVEKWRGRFQQMTSTLCQTLKGEPWGGPNVCRQVMLAHVGDLVDEPSVAYWADLFQPDTPEEEATWFQSWYLQAVLYMCGLAERGSEHRDATVHGLTMAKSPVLANETQRAIAVATCQSAPSDSELIGYRPGLLDEHIGPSELKIGATYDQEDSASVRRRRVSKVAREEAMQPFL